MAKKQLSEKQWAAIAILSQPKRAGMTYEQIAEQVGVHRDTLLRWRKDDTFNEALKKQIVANTIDRLPEIFDSIPDHIIKDGNAAMFRTLLQAHGLLTDKVEVESKNEGTIDIDAIRERLLNGRKDG